MNNFKTLFLKLLDIINYTDDRETFASEFIKNTQIQSVIDLTNTLPPDKAEEIKKQLASAQNNQEKVEEISNSFLLKNKLNRPLKNRRRCGIEIYTSY